MEALCFTEELSSEIVFAVRHCESDEWCVMASREAGTNCICCATLSQMSGVLWHHVRQEQIVFAVGHCESDEWCVMASREAGTNFICLGGVIKVHCCGLAKGALCLGLVSAHCTGLGGVIAALYCSIV